MFRCAQSQSLEPVSESERAEEIAAISALMRSQGRAVRVELWGNRHGLVLAVWAVDDGVPFIALEELIEAQGFEGLMWDGDCERRLYAEVGEDEPWGLP